jgi:CubicO group peptidase (beta-lactamase class C family)
MVRTRVCILLAGSALAQSRPDIDSVVDKAMAEWQVPGLVLAAVEDGRVIHQKAYGLRDVKRNLPVTAKTLFGIGSITKSFTVLVLQTLAEEGKLQWERPVRDYLPDFRLQDAVVTERATPLDLVTHRTGLPRHDGLWGAGTFTRRDIFARLRFLEPSRDFRAEFQYNNLMYLTAGVLAETVAGQTWEDLVRQRILGAARMSSTLVHYADAARQEDSATGYEEIKSELVERPIEQSAPAIDEAGPAGSLQSNIEDMTRYLRLHLEAGELEGRRLLARRRFDEMRTPRVVIPDGPVPSPYGAEQSYGMGLFLTHHRGRKVVYHTGTYAGYHALLWWLPEEKFGLVMMLNRAARAVPAVIALTMTDRFLAAPATDWHVKLKSFGCGYFGTTAWLAESDLIGRIGLG